MFRRLTTQALALSALSLAATHANAKAPVPLTSFELGLNTLDAQISDDIGRLFSRRLFRLTDHRIDWIDLVISDHVGSPNGSTGIDYSVLEDDSIPGLDFAGTLPGDGTYRIFEGAYAEYDQQIDFLTVHSGETSGASTSLQWRVFVSEVPEPNSLALLSMGGLVLMRRRRKI